MLISSCADISEEYCPDAIISEGRGLSSPLPKLFLRAGAYQASNAVCNPGKNE